MPTTQEYLNDLITQKNNLVINLNAKGVSATVSEKFNTLVPKVLNIPYNAICGEWTPQQDTKVFSVTDLPFAPKRFNIENTEIWGGSDATYINTWANITIDLDRPTYVGVGQLLITDTTSTSGYQKIQTLFKASSISNNVTVTDNSFTFTTSSAGVYEPVVFRAGQIYRWMIS